MGINTKIEYCDSTINPVMGCTGCKLYHTAPEKNHCYAATLVRRYGGRNGWPDSFDEPEIFDYRIPQAIAWPDLTGTKRDGKPWLNGLPRIVFVNDLGDGFCPDVDPQDWLTPHLDEMAASPHVWLLLTKWPHLMDQYFRNTAGEIPSNFWMGTTVTNSHATWRIVSLMSLKLLDASLWLSVEPLLGELDLRNVAMRKHPDGNDDMLDALTGRCWFRETCIAPGMHEPHPGDGISWVAAGGESGRSARPTHPDWARSIRDQCREAQIPFFWKQNGMLLHTSQMVPGVHYAESDGRPDGDRYVRCASKYAAGRLLDGREWNEMPKWPA